MKQIYSILLTGLIVMNALNYSHADDQSQQTLAVAKAFLDAAGRGDSTKLGELMTDDFVWHNEGNTDIPWIGDWQGKQTVLKHIFTGF